MNPIVFHIAGGDAFFSGTGCILAAVGLGFHRKAWVRQCATLLTIVGLLLVTVSATPLSYWYYGIAGVVSIGWIVVIRPDTPDKNRRRLFAVFMTVVWLAGVGLELRYRFSPTIEYDRRQPVVVYGDSITAGLGEGEAETWPAILKRKHDIDIRDFSRVGAKVDTVIRIIERRPKQTGIALVEIGGNDLLGTTTVADFERNLDLLLGLLTERHSTVVLFELPLLPFKNEYGRVQRRLAQKYEVKLIPKRVLMGILADDGATLDSIHLTQSGHNRMAEVVLRLLGRD